MSTEFEQILRSLRLLVARGKPVLRGERLIQTMISAQTIKDVDVPRIGFYEQRKPK